MTIFYLAQKGSEAAKRIAAYRETNNREREKAWALAEELGFVPGDTLTCAGDLAGFRLKAGAKAPEEWSHVKNFPGYVFPKGRKVNREVLKRVKAIRMGDVGDVAEAVFGEATFYVGSSTRGGMRCARGVGIEAVSGREIISFIEEGHVRDYEKKDWPKGLRRVKESSVVKWREQDKEAES